MTILSSWILAARPKTLTASLVPILATTAMVKSFGFDLNWWLVFCALFSSFCIQIGTNLVNDAMDFKKGADNEKRIGPVRVTQQGVFTYKQVMFMAGVFFILSAVFGIPLVLAGGWPIVILGLLSILMGYAYTSGPIPLAYYGLGDLFVIIFFGLVAVGGLFYILTNSLLTPALVLGLQIGLLSTVLIAINNLRDIYTDVEVNKKTLAVRLGEGKAKIWIVFLVFAPLLLGAYWLTQNKIGGAILPLLSLPLAILIVKNIIKTAPSSIYNKYLGMSALYSLVFSVLIAIGFLI